MTDVTDETTPPKEEEVATSEVQDDAPDEPVKDVWKPVEDVATTLSDWTDDDIQVFTSQDFGDTVLLDEEGQGGWSWDLVNSRLMVDPTVTSASDFVKLVRADAEGGEMTVAQIFDKYACDGY